MPIVPTLINIATFPEIADRAEAKFPRYAAHMRALWQRRNERILEAYEAGVPIYAGTDAGSVIGHGRIVDEIHALHAAGLPAERRWTRRPGPRGNGWERTASRKVPAPTSYCANRTPDQSGNAAGPQTHHSSGPSAPLGIN